MSVIEEAIKRIIAGLLVICAIALVAYTINFLVEIRPDIGNIVGIIGLILIGAYAIGSILMKE